MITRHMVLAWAGVLFLAGSLKASAQGAPWQNDALPVAQRVADLVGRMTLEEKVLQMKDVAPAIPRLGIPEYNWWNEALHGVARVRARHRVPAGHRPRRDVERLPDLPDGHRHLRRGARQAPRVRRATAAAQRYQGLTFWSPNINLFRDPRWGRGQETLRRGPVPDRPARRAVHPRAAGRRPQVLQDRRHGEALRRAQRPGARAPRVRRRGQRARPARELPAALRGRHPRGRGVLGDVRVQPRLRQGRRAAATCCSRTSCAASGASRATSSPTAARSTTSTCATRCVPTARRGGGARREDRHRPRLRPRLSQPGRGRAARVSSPRAQIDTSVTRLFLARFQLGMFDPPEQVRWAQIPISVLDQPSHRALARAGRARVDGAAEERPAARCRCRKDLRHDRRDRTERRPVADAARQLQRHARRPGHAAARDPRGGVGADHARAVRPRRRPRRRRSRCSRACPPSVAHHARRAARPRRRVLRRAARCRAAPLFSARGHRRQRPTGA